MPNQLMTIYLTTIVVSWIMIKLFQMKLYNEAKTNSKLDKIVAMHQYQKTHKEGKNIVYFLPIINVLFHAIAILFSNFDDEEYIYDLENKYYNSLKSHVQIHYPDELYEKYVLDKRQPELHVVLDWYKKNK